MPPKKTFAAKGGPSKRTLATKGGPSKRTLAAKGGLPRKTLTAKAGPPRKTLAAKAGPPKKTLPAKGGPSKGTIGDNEDSSSPKRVERQSASRAESEPSTTTAPDVAPPNQESTPIRHPVAGGSGAQTKIAPEKPTATKGSQPNIEGEEASPSPLKPAARQGERQTSSDPPSPATTSPDGAPPTQASSPIRVPLAGGSGAQAERIRKKPSTAKGGQPESPIESEEESRSPVEPAARRLARRISSDPPSLDTTSLDGAPPIQASAPIQESLAGGDGVETEVPPTKKAKPSGPKEKQGKELTVGDKRKRSQIGQKEKGGKEPTGEDATKRSRPPNSKEASKPAQGKKRRASQIDLDPEEDSTEEDRKQHKPNKVMREIELYQNSTSCLIPFAPFCKLVKEITTDLTKCPDIRYKAQALRALQEAAESYIVGLMEDAYLITCHARRKTLYTRDMRLAYRIRGDFNRF